MELERAAEQLGVAGWTLEAAPESHTSQVRFASRGTERAVLKVFTNAAKLARETAALTSLHAYSKVPRVLATCEDPPAMLMTRLPGRPVHVVMEKLAWEIGECLANMQSVAVPTMRDWWSTLRELVATQLAISRGQVQEVDWDRVEAMFDQQLAGREPVEQRLVHFDFRLGNLLTAGDSLTGLVDFESARAGAVDFDFTMPSIEIWQPHPALENAMLAGYASTRAVPERLHENLRLYRLYSPMSAIGWCAKRGRRDAFFYRNLRELQVALDELR